MTELSAAGVPDTPALRVLIVLASCLAMELVAALVHRFWMHGPGWAWHRSHHEPGRGRLERNDLYALVFAALAVAGFVLGHGRWWPLYWVATGVTLYGLLYALVHDGLVHRRWPWPWRWTPRRGYLARLVQAHRLHHAVQQREGCLSFGFLYAPPPDRLAARLRARRQGGPAGPGRVAAGGPHQGAIGLALAALIVAAWCTTLSYALLLHRVGPWDLLVAPLLVALIAWLKVGLFIVAHDAMHGSLWPGRRSVNQAVGRLALLLYGGFWLPRIERHHHGHHRHPGTADDPDFHLQPRRFWPWYAAFMRRYIGWLEAAGPVLIALLLVFVLQVAWANLLLFWALPALLSSLQLFFFGTWLPHRHADDSFADAHRARSSRFGWLASLLSCFHFGYHHEHHLRPDAPWWRLPALTPAGAPTAAREPAADRRAPSG